MPRRAVLPQSKLKKQRRVRRLRLIIAIAVLVLLLAGSVVGLLWIPYIRIHSVVVLGVETVASDALLTQVRTELHGTYLYVLPKDNILLYPHKKIIAAIRAAYPAISTADVRTAGFSSIRLTVAERHPSALWCGEVVDAGESCSLMDSDGFVYAPSAEISGNAYLNYFGPATTTSGYTAAVAPKQFLKPEEFRALVALVAAFALNQKDTAVSRVFVDDNSDVHLSFADGFSVFFALRDTRGDVFERFTLALGADPFLGHPLSDFEYLDLRFGDKLYYKVKNK